MTAVAQKHLEAAQLRVERQMIAGKSADAQRVRAHVRGHFAQTLLGMPGEAQKAQRLAVGAVRVAAQRAVRGDFPERCARNQLALQQRLRKARHVLPGGEQPRVAAEVAPALRQQQRLGVVRRARRRVRAQHIPLARDAVLIVVADAALLFILRHGGKRLAHAGGRKDVPAERTVKRQAGFGLDHIFDHHGVDVRIDAHGGRGRDAHVKEAAQALLTAGRIVDAAGRLQADTVAQRIKDGDITKVRKARIDFPDPLIQAEHAALHERHRRHRREELGQRREVEDAVFLKRALAGEKPTVV